MVNSLRLDAAPPTGNQLSSFCLSRSSPVLSLFWVFPVSGQRPRSQSNTHNPSPQSATNSYTITNLNNQAIVPSFNASRTTHRATLVVIITAIAICFNDRSSPTDKSFQLLTFRQSCKFHATERLARRREQCLNLGHSRLTSVCRVGITIVPHV